MENYARRAYLIEPETDADTTPKAVEIIVRMDGKDFARMVLTDPGMIAVLRKPAARGIWIETVRPGGVRYTDVPTPEAMDMQEVTDWQRAALTTDESESNK
jgi:hypothetical protein